MSVHKILLMGAHDWANAGCSIARAINLATGTKLALAIRYFDHKYEYDYTGHCTLTKEDSTPNLPDIIGASKFGDTAKILLLFGDCYGDAGRILNMLQLPPPEDWQYKFKIHLGSIYRTNSDDYNARDVELGFLGRFAGFDSTRLFDNKLPSWGFYPPIDITNNNRKPSGFKVGHPSTHYAQKGIESILAMLDKLDSDYGIKHCAIEGQSHRDYLVLRESCHAFVDQLYPNVGAIGFAGYEALHQGCIVLGDARHSPANTRPGGFIHVESVNELGKELVALYRDKEYWEHLQSLRKQWCEDHTAKKLGAWWLQKIEECL